MRDFISKYKVKNKEEDTNTDFWPPFTLTYTDHTYIHTLCTHIHIGYFWFFWALKLYLSNVTFTWRYVEALALL